MSERANYAKLSPRAMNILLEQERYLRDKFTHNDSVTLIIWELIKLRASQINHCAYCLDMHSKDALKLGESPDRIYALSAWEESPLYTELERSALAWAELILSNQPVSDDDYQRAKACFGEENLLDLTIAVNAINSWNRIAKTFKPVVGSYQAD